MSDLTELMDIEYFVLNAHEQYLDQIWMGNHYTTIWVYYTDLDYIGGYN